MTSDSWTIRPFAPADAPAFAALNRRWIEEMFGMEEKDVRQLEHPKDAILDPFLEPATQLDVTRAG